MTPPLGPVWVQPSEYRPRVWAFLPRLGLTSSMGNRCLEVGWIKWCLLIGWRGL